MKRRTIGERKKKLYTKRFFPAGNYTWVVPDGCTEVDVFLVGGGGAGASYGGGGGYTNTKKKVSVKSGEVCNITVGKGGVGNTDTSGGDGEMSSFKANSTTMITASGGIGSQGPDGFHAGNGGSGGGNYGDGGSDGSDGFNTNYSEAYAGTGQHYTTRDFGEPTGKRNAGGGGGQDGTRQFRGGESDYSQGRGEDGTGTSYFGLGGGGYGGGGGAWRSSWGKGGNGGDGTVLIRYYAY